MVTYDILDPSKLEQTWEGETAQLLDKSLVWHPICNVFFCLNYSCHPISIESRSHRKSKTDTLICRKNDDVDERAWGWPRPLPLRRGAVPCLLGPAWRHFPALLGLFGSYSIWLFLRHGQTSRQLRLDEKTICLT